MDFIQQYGKNRQRCQQNKFYYVVWQLLLYYYREFPSKIFSVYYDKKCVEKNLNKLEQSSDFWISNSRKDFTFVISLKNSLRVAKFAMIQRILKLAPNVWAGGWLHHKHITVRDP